MRRLDELGLDREPAAEPLEQLVLHRRVHVRARSARAASPSRPWGTSGPPSARAPQRSSGCRSNVPARCSTSRSREPSLIASTQISDRPLPSRVRSCTPLARTLERAVVHVPDRQRQRRQRLEVVPRQVLLAVAQVDRLTQLGQLGQRGEVDERRALGVRAAATARCCRTATPSSRGSRPASRRDPCGTGCPGCRGCGSATALPSPMSPPRTTCHCWSPSRCGCASITRSPATSSPASRHPPGVRTRWLARQPPSAPGRCHRDGRR